MTVDSVVGVLLIGLGGRLGPRAARQLADCLGQAVRGRRPVVVDLSDVEHLDRASVEALVVARRRLGVCLRLAAPRSGAAARALRDAGVAHAFALHDSRAAALATAVPAPDAGRRRPAFPAQSASLGG